MDFEMNIYVYIYQFTSGRLSAGATGQEILRRPVPCPVKTIYEPIHLVPSPIALIRYIITNADVLFLQQGLTLARPFGLLGVFATLRESTKITVEDVDFFCTHSGQQRAVLCNAIVDFLKIMW